MTIAGQDTPLRLLALVTLAVVLVASGCGGAESPPRASNDGGTISPEAAAGKELAGQFCSSCHGQDFNGVSGLGTSFHNNAFIRDHTDAQLVAFIKEGRASDAADNETGVPMPPYGGNPRLTDEQLSDIILFLRTLQ